MNTNHIPQRAETRHIARMLRQATPVDLHRGTTWYTIANITARRLADTYNTTPQHAAAVIAALSPRNSWNRNVRDAATVLFHWHQNRTPTDATVSTFRSNLLKAARILDASPEDIPTILYGRSGRKILSFYHSILGDTDDVVVDGHAYSIFVGRRIPIADTPPIGAPLYRTIQRAYTLVARRSPDLIGQRLTPSQVQATTWTTYRRIHSL